MKLDVKSTRTRTIIDFRKYGFTDLQILGKYNYTRAESHLENHVHHGMIEICYCDKGKQFFEVKGKQYLVKGGEVFIHFPGELHGSGGYPEEKGSIFWLIIRLNNSVSDSLVLLCELLWKQGKRHFKGQKELKKILAELYEVHTKNEEDRIKKIRIRILVQSFLLSLYDSANKHIVNGSTHRLQKVFNYIGKNITNSISIASLAKEVNLSESRFKILFKELTGFTPADFIQRKRVDMALDKMKKEPTATITDIAYELNFSSTQYFSTVVKKYTGQSLKDLKKKFHPN